MRHIFSISFITLICVISIHAQDSLNMTKLSHVDGLPGNAYNDCWGYAKQNGSEYAIIGSKQAINIFNISDPKNPILDTSINDGNNRVWRDFKTYGNYIYAVCDQGAEGLEIISKINYTFTQSTTDFTTSHNIFIDSLNARLYVVGTNTVSEGMIIYDLSQNPSNPQMIKKIKLDTLLGVPNRNLYIHDIFVKDNIAYASHFYDQKFMIWNLENLDSIYLMGQYSWPANHSSWLDKTGEYVYDANEQLNQPMRILKITPSSFGQVDIDFIKSFRDPLEAPQFLNNIPHNPFVKGDGLYISYYHDGVQVYDISDPINPLRVAYYDTYLPNNGSAYSSFHGCWGVYPYLPSGTIIASDLESGLYLLKLEFGKVIVDQGNLLIQEAAKGILFADSMGTYQQMNVNSLGEIEITQTNTLNEISSLKNSDLVFSSNSNKLILKSLDNRYYQISISNSGTLQIEGIVNLPTLKSIIPNGNLLIDNKNKGIIMLSPDGKRWKTSVTPSGQLKSYLYSF